MRNRKYTPEEYQPFEEDDFGDETPVSKVQESKPQVVEKTPEQLALEFEERRRARTRGSD